MVGVFYICLVQLGYIVGTCDLPLVLGSAVRICLVSTDDDLDLVHTHNFGHALPPFTYHICALQLLLGENLEKAQQCVNEDLYFPFRLDLRSS